MSTAVALDHVGIAARDLGPLRGQAPEGELAPDAGVNLVGQARTFGDRIKPHLCATLGKARSIERLRVMD